MSFEPYQIPERGHRLHPDEMRRLAAFKLPPWVLEWLRKTSTSKKGQSQSDLIITALSRVYPACRPPKHNKAVEEMVKTMRMALVGPLEISKTLEIALRDVYFILRRARDAGLEFPVIPPPIRKRSPYRPKNRGRVYRFTD
jgi:hypothetical protein